MPVCEMLPQMDPAEVREHVSRAGAIIDQMLEGIMREMFVDQAAAYVTSEVGRRGHSDPHSLVCRRCSHCPAGP